MTHFRSHKFRLQRQWSVSTAFACVMVAEKYASPSTGARSRCSVRQTRRARLAFHRAACSRHVQRDEERVSRSRPSRVARGGGLRVPADMVGQFRVRTCPDRARATDGRVWRRLFEGAIDAGSRDRPHTGNARQAITASTGARERPAHRLDLLWAKGRLPSSAAREQFVVHGDLASRSFRGRAQTPSSASAETVDKP